MLGANKSGPSDLRDIVLTYSMWCARVFVVVCANWAKELAMTGPHVGIRYSNTWLANSKPSDLINNENKFRR